MTVLKYSLLPSQIHSRFLNSIGPLFPLSTLQSSDEPYNQQLPIQLISCCTRPASRAVSIVYRPSVGNPRLTIPRSHPSSHTGYELLITFYMGF